MMVESVPSHSLDVAERRENVFVFLGFRTARRGIEREQLLIERKPMSGEIARLLLLLFWRHFRYPMVWFHVLQREAGRTQSASFHFCRIICFVSRCVQDREKNSALSQYWTISNSIHRTECEIKAARAIAHFLNEIKTRFLRGRMIVNTR